MKYPNTLDDKVISVLQKEPHAGAIVDKQIDYLDQRLTTVETDMINPIEFGEVKAELAAQRRDLDRIANSLAILTEQMAEANNTLTEAKGGWKALMFVGGVSATLGGAISWVLTHVKFV